MLIFNPAVSHALAKLFNAHWRPFRRKKAEPNHQRTADDKGRNKGGLKGAATRRPLKKSFAPLTKLPSMTPYPCGCLKMVALLIEAQQRTRRKEDQFGAMTLFFLFFLENNKKPEKKWPTQKFWPPQNEILSLRTAL